MSTATPIKQAINVGGRTHLWPNEIVCLVADTNYTVLHLSNGNKITVSYNLGKLEGRLILHRSFVRANRSTIVNLDFMSEYTTEHLRILEKQVVFSRRRKENVLNTIEVLESNKNPIDKGI